MHTLHGCLLQQQAVVIAEQSFRDIGRSQHGGCDPRGMCQGCGEAARKVLPDRVSRVYKWCHAGGRYERYSITIRHGQLHMVSSRARVNAGQAQKVRTLTKHKAVPNRYTIGLHCTPATPDSHFQRQSRRHDCCRPPSCTSARDAVTAAATSLLT